MVRQTIQKLKRREIHDAGLTPDAVAPRPHPLRPVVAAHRVRTATANWRASERKCWWRINLIQPAV